jgi:hypothetical protein
MPKNRQVLGIFADGSQVLGKFEVFRSSEDMVIGLPPLLTHHEVVSYKLLWAKSQSLPIADEYHDNNKCYHPVIDI